MPLPREYGTSYTSIKNAYYLVAPSESSAEARKERLSEHQFIRRIDVSIHRPDIVLNKGSWIEKETVIYIKGL